MDASFSPKPSGATEGNSEAAFSDSGKRARFYDDRQSDFEPVQLSKEIAKNGLYREWLQAAVRQAHVVSHLRAGASRLQRLRTSVPKFVLLTNLAFQRPGGETSGRFFRAPNSFSTSPNGLFLVGSLIWARLSVKNYRKNVSSFAKIF